MALTETQSWDSIEESLCTWTQRRTWNRVMKFLCRWTNRRRQVHELLLRVIRGLRDPSNPYALYPEIDRDILTVYDNQIYDHTFRARSLSVAPTRKATGYVLEYWYFRGGDPPDRHKWVVPEECDINQFLLDRLAELDWRRRK